jgi:hypothetical protein
MEYRIKYSTDNISYEDFNELQDEIINTLIPHLALYGYSVEFTKHTYVANELPLISNISNIEKALDTMAKTFNYEATNDNYVWQEAKDWESGGIKLFGYTDWNRWLNNMVFILNYKHKDTSKIYLKFELYDTLAEGEEKQLSPLVIDDETIFMIGTCGTTLSFKENATTGNLYRYNIEEKEFKKIEAPDEYYVSYGLISIYGSNIYLFRGGDASKYGGLPNYHYYKYNYEKDEWAGVIKDNDGSDYYLYEQPYLFTNPIEDVIYRNGKFLFSYIEKDKYIKNSLLDYYRELQDYSEEKLTFIEFNPRTDEWSKLNIEITANTNGISYDGTHASLTLDTDGFYVSVMVENDGKKYPSVYKITDNGAILLTQDVPVGRNISKIIKYSGYLLIFTFGIYDDYKPKIYAYKISTKEFAIINIFTGEYRSQYGANYFIVDDALYMYYNKSIYKTSLNTLDEVFNHNK